MAAAGARGQVDGNGADPSVVADAGVLVVEDLHHQALLTGDFALHLAADALRAVQALFADFAGLADRGSAQQQARIAIHDAITAAFEAHTAGRRPACGPQTGTGGKACLAEEPGAQRRAPGQSQSGS